MKNEDKTIKLKFSKIPGFFDLECDACGKPMRPKETVWECGEVNMDICNDCMKKLERKS